MKNNLYVIFSLGGIALSQMLGCANSGAPREMLPDLNDRHTLSYGGWISIRMVGNEFDWDAKGELIAISKDSLYLRYDYHELVALPLDKIDIARLTAYDANVRRLGAWTILGTLSTLSHGVWHGVGLIVSAPAWVLLGGLATAFQSRAPIVNYPQKGWDEFRLFARFPQGLPERYDRGIRPNVRIRAGSD